ncbi:cbb3-type cytochrome oxidase assembly protein CcoS [Uliginosibacterium sp. H3]|uniref:Cbb3-type cytochrome oxidase assembly protein CcoS n=1 Tax=Uliginosibacterium silvisoli TaxID=3114758 RepID=A0ABU6K030_9RHOO|nr:cbb3-type cytochrome oxidase assembly protein CcoS [Uliginosibacterium sp. H3]
MDILFLLIPVSVILALSFVVVFYWALKEGQFEDLDRPGRAILDDDDG